MKSNQTEQYMSVSGHDEERLEAILDSCRPEAYDNSRIKSLVHGRILADKLARTRRMLKVSMWSGAAACIGLLCMIGARFISTEPTIDLSTATMAQADEAGYHELVVDPGKRVDMTLPDGTRLVANSHSRVLYPERFTGDERRIYADGEVYLEVTKDAGHPFVVQSRGFDVKVLGTTFNICNTSDSTAQVVLVEGSVELTTELDSRVRLRPNDLVDLVNGEVSSMRQVDTNDYTLWVDGLLSLRGERLGRLVERLSEHYGLVIDCDASLQDVRVYGKLDLHDSIEHVLESIGEIVPIEIEREGSLITMRTKV